MNRCCKVSWALTLCALVIAALLSGHAHAADAWSYAISPGDTPGVIDAGATTAIVDVTAQEIRLPLMGRPSALSFWPDGSMDYVVMTSGRIIHYSWDGAEMVENPLVSVPLDANPLGLAAPLPFPDVVVAVSDGTLRRYSFTGSEMLRNPALEVAGLTGMVSVGARADGSVAVLADEVKAFLFDGTQMVHVPFLQPSVPLTNPTALALKPDAFDMAVLDVDPISGEQRVRFFGFDGSGMVEIPQLAITGLANARAIAYGPGGDLAIIAGSEARHYGFDGEKMVYVAALSVDGLEMPSSIAIRPGAPDRIILDGKRIRYFAWDGAQLVEDPSRSVELDDAPAAGAFAAGALAQSSGRHPNAAADRVRVRAAHELSPDTVVTWSVSADGGANWTVRWRARADAAGATYCDVTPDNGLTWQTIGDAAACGPNKDRPELWASVTPGTDVRWRAELATANPANTPLVATSPRGGIAVVWEADARPNAPVPEPEPPGVCRLTTQPELRWTFSDPDPGDHQTAFQVEIRRQDDGALVHDSGKFYSGAESYVVPTSDDPAIPGPLWQAETYRFTWRVRTWDAMDQESDWSIEQPFCVTALERARIAEIVAAPDGQVEPDPDNPATHIIVRPGTALEELPRVRAGAKVRVLVDGVGPAQAFHALFSYADGSGQVRHATLGNGSPVWTNPAGAETNRWTIELWTEPRKDITPDGAVMEADLAADAGAVGEMRVGPDPFPMFVIDGSIYELFKVILWR